MLKIALVRGKFLNNFEGQNYLFSKKDIKITGISSLFPIDANIAFPVKKYSSIADFSELPLLKHFDLWHKAVKYLSNRILGDSQTLFFLENCARDFDIFHTADPHYFYSYQLAKLRAENKIKRLIVTSWETIPFNNESVKKKKYIKTFTQKHADHFICYTKRAKEALLKEGIGKKKISVINLGVDLNKFKPAKKLKKKEIVILFVGRLVEEKGILDILEIFNNIVLSSRLKWRDPFLIFERDFPLCGTIAPDCARNDRIRLRIIGNGTLKNKLTHNIQKNKLTNLVSIETKKYKNMPKVYQQADIFVLPSKKTKTWEEQYGMVLMEALACGLPVVSYESGAIPEIIGDSGCLVKTDDKKGLRQAIRKLIIDDKLRDKLGTLARKRAEKYFDAKKTAEKIAAVYKKVYNKD